MSKKLKSTTVFKPDVKGSDKNLQQAKSAKIPSDIKKDDTSQLEGSELFSFFTANIIKEKKVFTR